MTTDDVSTARERGSMVPAIVRTAGQDATGLAVGGLLVALSLFPSLLPRSSSTQGIASGVMFAVGYGLGAMAGGAWRQLGLPSPRGRARQVVAVTVLVLVSLAIAAATWQHVGWQNEVREITGVPPTTPATWPPLLVVAVAVAAGLLAIGRGVRRVVGNVVARLARRLPGRLARVAGTVLVLLVVWGLWSGVVVTGFFALANRVSAPRDAATEPGVVRPTASTRSGSPDSVMSWDSLGRKGRSSWRPVRRRTTSTGPLVEVPSNPSGSTPGCDPPTRPRHGPTRPRHGPNCSAPGPSSGPCWSWPPPPARASSTPTASTRSSTSTTVTPRSWGCSTPTCPVGSPCWPTRTPSSRSRGSCSTPSTTTGRRSRQPLVHASTSTACRSGPSGPRPC